MLKKLDELSKAYLEITREDIAEVVESGYAPISTITNNETIQELRTGICTSFVDCDNCVWVEVTGKLCTEQQCLKSLRSNKIIESAYKSFQQLGKRLEKYITEYLAKDHKCPFCGYDSTTILMDANSSSCQVECTTCKARGPEKSNEYDAIYYWRKRK